MKLLHLLKSSVILISISGTFNAFSQTLVSTDFVDLKNTRPTDWQTYLDDNSVKIDFILADCDPEMGYDNQSILFRVENKTE